MIRQWTVAGSPALEQQIDQMIQGLRSRLQHAFGPEDYRVVVIAGGYGRGEGGVDTRHGGESLHNNLDLIWVTPHTHRVDAIRERLVLESRHFLRQYGVALDSFVIDEARLRRLPCLVLLYDMAHGHRLLLGKPGELQRLIPYRAKDILPSDVRNLLVNRGTLLLINRWLFESHPQAAARQREQIVRHAMKALIGLGDAMLFMRGEYHWSYLEKQRRINAAVDLPLQLRQLYHQAAEFRFRPDYAAFADYSLQDLQAWNERLLHLVATGHQRFEAWRLGQSPSRFVWENYPARALRHSLGAEWGYRGMRLRRLKHFVCNQASSRYLGPLENMGLRALDHASLLALMFPLLAGDLNDSRYLEWVREQLNSEALTSQELLGDYLRTWGSYLDPALLPQLTAWQKQEVQV
ncbi:MAG: hypothetical protein ACO1RX_20810 [Candidatus Sericytochromatia bacterium]